MSWALVFLIYISRVSLLVFRSHGFYRFFAWETILCLILLNIDIWFLHPFSILQIMSWIFLIVSLMLLWKGLYLIRTKGKPSIHRQDKTLLALEKTSALITSGIFRYIRHPLYSSLLFLAWGVFLKNVTLPTLFLVIVATICLVGTGKADEIECIKYFGASYKEYMLRSKMFVPFLFLDLYIEF